MARIVASVIDTAEMRIVSPAPPRMYALQSVANVRVCVPGGDDGHADERRG